MDTLATSHTESWLSWLWRGILIVGFLFLLGRSLELQLIKGDHFHTLAEGNRIRRVVLLAPRGRILARGGEVLVGNLEVKKEVVFDSEVGYTKKEITKDSQPDVVVSEWTRDYLLGEKFAHAGGYVSEVDPEEVGKTDPNCTEKGPRHLGSFIGRGGLEEQYECRLRGIDGEELIEVDMRGRKVRTLGVREATPGVDLLTTIDLALQTKVAETFANINSVPQIKLQNEGDRGAAIVSDTQGEVLAFYSAPSFDPTDVAKSVNNSSLPLFNRLIGGTYHPGSTFKIVTATAGLEEKKINKDYVYEDPGVIKVNEYSYANWYFSQYGKTEGKIGLVRAFARSTDTFFYKLGEMVGVNNLAAWANRFGYGTKTGIDLPGEVAGLVPTPQWKESVKGESWFLGNTYHMAIGQGDLAVTPLAVNQATSVVANGGDLCQPFLVKKKTTCQNLGIKKETLALIKQGMEGACATGGTGYPFFGFSPQVACKTGTAETYSEGKTHAWFTVFAPVENPEVVTTVLIEDGGEGSYAAAPVAKEILGFYFQKNRIN